MKDDRIINGMESRAPRHLGIALICIFSILAELFLAIMFGWKLITTQEWASLMVDIIITVVLFVVLGNIAIWDLWGRETITLYDDRMVVKRKRLIPLSWTYIFSEIDFDECRPFESTDSFSRWGRRTGHRGGMVRIARLGRTDYLGIGLTVADAEKLTAEIKQRCNLIQN